MFLSGSDEAVGIDRDDNPDARCRSHWWLLLHNSIIDRWIRKSTFPLYWVCTASAICQQLKKNGRHRSFVARFRQNDEDSIIDESLDLELAVDGYMWPRLSERSSTGDVDRLKRRHEAIPERPRRFEALVTNTNMDTQGLGLP
jgi:hypothetical protein